MAALSYISVRELLDLLPNERLGECSRCDAPARSADLLQLRVVGHHVALCIGCLHLFVGLVEPVAPEPFAGKTVDAWL